VQAQLVRCAVYTRYSSDLQRPASTEDQIRNCQDAADREGWTIVGKYIFSDEEITGQTLVGRNVDELIRLAKTCPKPFDGIIIDDTSRLGRYVPDVLRVTDILESYGVFVYFAAQRLDSRAPGFRQVFTIFAMMDEQYVAQLADKVRRGQRGRVLKGCVPGGKCYGYQNIPIEDPTRRGEYGRPAVIGVWQRPLPQQAAVVLRIFQMYAAGLSYARIAKSLNREGVLSPQPPRKGKVRGWSHNGIREMLRNEKYHGVLVYDRTKTIRNRETGRCEQRPRPESEWMRIDVPEMRIVSEELWNAVREQNRRVRDKHGAKTLGGMNRTAASRGYLFSGLLECGWCDRNITITSGKAPYSRYGCPNNRFKDLCSNQVTILQTRLEQQLISWLVKNLLRPELAEELFQLFHDAVTATIENEARLAQEAANRNSELHQELAKHQKEAQNLAEAIAQQRISPTLSKRLATTEARISEIEDLLNAPKEVKIPRFSPNEIRDALREQTQRLAEILTGDRAIARQELQKRIDKLILTPRETAAGWVLDVSGSIGLFAGASDVMLTNSFQGIGQHYTLPRIPISMLLDPSLTLAA